MKKIPKQSAAVLWPIEIKTRRLILRPYKPSDYGAWREGFASRQPRQHEFDNAPPLSSLTKNRFERMLRRHKESSQRDMGYVWAVFQKRSGKVLGGVDLYVFGRGDMQSANFGYVIHNQHWGHGYGREAARAAALAAFRKIRLHRLEATIGVGNKASLKLIQSIGFKYEGLRKRSDWRGGRWQDDHVYYATPDDFGLLMRPPSVQREY